MLSVIYKPCMLSDVMLNVVMLNVVALTFYWTSVTMKMSFNVDTREKVIFCDVQRRRIVFAE